MGSVKNIAWWTAWGLAIGAGLFALRESFRESHYFILAMPLLAGALAAGASRLRHEFHSAASEIRWLALGSIAVLVISAFLYTRAGGYGPFSTGGSQRAFLGVTFGMSVPEVERVLDRRLEPLDSPREIVGSMSEWVTDFITPGRRGRAQYLLPDLELLGSSCQARLDFVQGRLCHVLIEYDRQPKDSAVTLVAKLRDELGRNYHPDASAISAAADAPTETVFRNEAVEARLTETPADAGNEIVAVELSYLPLIHGQPLRADRQVF